VEDITGFTLKVSNFFFTWSKGTILGDTPEWFITNGIEWYKVFRPYKRNSNKMCTSTAAVLQLTAKLQWNISYKRH